MTTAKSSSNKPANEWKPFSHPVDYLLPDLIPPQVLSVRETESDLYGHWSAAIGRSVMGTGGQYHILDPGRLNGGPGPDFTGASVLFPDGTIRQGDAELHLVLSGWASHGHGTDPRYAHLLVHVVGTGDLKPVRAMHGLVPTLLLPREPLPASRPCEDIHPPLDTLPQDEINDFIRTLAAQRWHRRLAGWPPDTTTLLPLLASRLGRGKGGETLYQEWRRHLPHSPILSTFLTTIGLGRGPEPAGAVTRKNQRRSRLLSAVAHQAHWAPGRWQPDGWEALQTFIDDLHLDGFSLPGIPYALEIAGNWLLPWLEATGLGDGYRHLMALPIGWHYRRVKRLTELLRQAPPATFGLQQGWLEWERTLCDPRNCEACPVSH